MRAAPPVAPVDAPILTATGMQSGSRPTAHGRAALSLPSAARAEHPLSVMQPSVPGIIVSPAPPTRADRLSIGPFTTSLGGMRAGDDTQPLPSPVGTPGGIPVGAAQTADASSGGHGQPLLAALAGLAAALLFAGRRLTSPALTLRQRFHTPLTSPG
jgi:hypothetical protein